MGIFKKLKWIVLPALFIIGLGILEIKFPHAMDGFDDNYTGRGMAGFIMLLIELFLLLTWGKIGGIITIIIGIIIGMLAFSLFYWPSKKNTIKESTKKSLTENDKSLTSLVVSTLVQKADQTYQNRFRK
jgi:hypothetical protein